MRAHEPGMRCSAALRIAPVSAMCVLAVACPIPVNLACLIHLTQRCFGMHCKKLSCVIHVSLFSAQPESLLAAHTWTTWRTFRLIMWLAAGVTRWNRPGIDVDAEPPAVKVNDDLGGILTWKLAGASQSFVLPGTRESFGTVKVHRACCSVCLAACDVGSLVNSVRAWPCCTLCSGAFAQHFGDLPAGAVLDIGRSLQARTWSAKVACRMPLCGRRR